MQIQDRAWRLSSYRLRISSLLVICVLLAGVAGFVWPSAFRPKRTESSFVFRPASSVATTSKVTGAGDVSSTSFGTSSSQVTTQLGQLAVSSQPETTPSTSGAGIYFSQTGHSIVTFKDFWQRSGGLETFGYPLSDEQVETDPDSGKTVVIQYFSTQILEYHPEFAGTPYEVQLQRLGADDAARRGLLSTTAFQPVAPPSTDRDDCVYYSETNHQVCGAFLDFLRTHGLEFGDSGISGREALALFGYPISEQFTNSATGAVTQYFERARMELQPGASGLTPVVLGWLGADLLYARQPSS